MKKLFFIGAVLILGFSFNLFAFAEENYITSKTLSKNDLVNAVKELTFEAVTILRGDYSYRPEDIRTESIQIVGIHQEGNHATIYAELAPRQRPTQLCTAKVVRFNSDAWFSPLDRIFLQK